MKRRRPPHGAGRVSSARKNGILADDSTSSRVSGYHRKRPKRLSRHARRVHRTQTVSPERYRRGRPRKSRKGGGNSASPLEQQMLSYQSVMSWRREKDSNPQYPNASPAQPHEFIIQFSILDEDRYQRRRLIFIDPNRLSSVWSPRIGRPFVVSRSLIPQNHAIIAHAQTVGLPAIERKRLPFWPASPPTVDDRQPYRALWSHYCRAQGRRPPSPLRSNLVFDRDRHCDEYPD
jgi:hypothetical protein